MGTEVGGGFRKWLWAPWGEGGCYYRRRGVTDASLGQADACRVILALQWGGAGVHSSSALCSCSPPTATDGPGDTVTAAVR